MNEIDNLKIRIVTVDYYMSVPLTQFDDIYSQFRGTEISRVPVIRIFGTTLNGQKTCLHVHNVYPYLSVPLNATDECDTHSHKLAHELECKLNPSQMQTRNKSRNSMQFQHIHDIEVFQAKSFYGYHENFQKFLRLKFYNPLSVQKTHELLTSGAVFGKTIPSYESHIPYILQFLIDHNLYGMNFIIAKNVYHRKSHFNSQLNDLSIPSMSSCEIECDVRSIDIINRNIQYDGNRNPGLQAIWDDIVDGNRDMIPQVSQERENVYVNETERFYLNQLSNILSNLNININENDDSSDSSQNLLHKRICVSQTNDRFARLIVECINDNDNDNDDSDSHISLEMSQKLNEIVSAESLIEDSDSQSNDNDGNDRISDDSDSTIIDDIINFNDECSNQSVADASTQTEINDNFDVINSMVDNLNCDDISEGEDFVDAVCDCDSEECCDLCCDRLSEQCECDCEKCEDAKCQKIPQIDGSFDNDDYDYISSLDYGLSFNDGQNYESILCNKSQSGFDEMKFDGINVKMSKKIPKEILKKIGHETVVLQRLTENDLINFKYLSQSKVINKELQYFYSSDYEYFYKTPLNGEAKMNFLLSMCNRSVSINLIRLNISETNNFSQNKSIISSDSIESHKDKDKDTSFEEIVSSETSDIKLAITNSLDCNELSSQESNFSSQSNSSGICIVSSRKRRFRQSTPVMRYSKRGKRQSLTNIVECVNENNQIEDNEKENDEKCSDEIKFVGESVSQSKSSDIPNSIPNDASNNAIPKRFMYDSLIEGPTLSNPYNFELSSVSNSNSGEISQLSEHEFQYLTLMSLEVHVSTRRDLKPDPMHDSIVAIFYTISNDVPQNSGVKTFFSGIIAIETDTEAFNCDNESQYVNPKRNLSSRSGIAIDENLTIEYADSEIVLFMKLVDIVKRHDPDIIIGYEIESLSWGYVLQRADALNVNIWVPLSRITEDDSKSYAFKVSDCQLTGRIMLNLWRKLQWEITLNVYTYENIHYHVLHERIPKYENSTLNEWFGNHVNNLSRWRVIDYYLTRSKGCLRILDKLNLISRTSELARLYGIQFFEVFSRGSQFRVESMMLRMAKRVNYVPLSPTPLQRSRMKAPEWIPLVMEPDSKLYTDPVAVLDFQSLYPSMMIAYNYCYCTCLGRVDHLIGDTNDFEFGCSKLNVPKVKLAKLKDNIHVSPNGVAFVTENVRKGILPQMLNDILNTRIMVKNAMKENNKKEHPNKGFHRSMDARQLGLKMIANVTYGYTAANFSGRMPCVEIADAIVSKGRETLERAIQLVTQNESKWGGKVIYGDTDSLFVLFPGCTKDEAFIKGMEIADAVTAINPKPVKLRFEKVYLPCVLQTKKRYVGFMYESPHQTEPVFNAKGIETVRRDTIPAVAKMLEKSIKIQFKTRDANDVKLYLQRQFQKILSGRISILDDFIFAREYRGIANYKPTACVPSLEIAKKRLSKDPRNEPKIGERVPYVVICGSPDQPIIQLVREPIEMINDPSLRLNSAYYIERVIIPPLNRVFNLIGHDVMKWYQLVPRKKTHFRGNLLGIGQTKTISQYFTFSRCAVCGNSAETNNICSECKSNPQASAIEICESIRQLQLKYGAVIQICKSCNGSHDNVQKCISIDCPNLFRYSQTKLDIMNISRLNSILESLK